MLLALINLGFGKHGLYHFVNVFVWLVVASEPLFLKVETYITSPLMPEFQKINTFFESAEYQKSFMRLFDVGIVITDIGP